MSKDKFPKFGPITPEDEQKMESLASKAKEILGEDERKMEEQVRGAKEILERAIEESEKGENMEALTDLDSLSDEDLEEDNVSPEQIETFIKKLEGELLDEKSSFYTNTERGSLDEVFYRTLMEEVPELGLSINETARSPHAGEVLKGYIAVETTPYKTDRQFIFNLETNPIIKVLRCPEFDSSSFLGRELERRGLLAKGTTKRSLARYYQERIRITKEFVEESFAKDDEKRVSSWERVASEWQERLSELGLEPFSDEEARELMRKVIREEYEKHL